MNEHTAKHLADGMHTPEVVRHGDKMALPEVSSLGDREPAGSSWFSPSARQDVFSSRTWAIVPPAVQTTHRVGPPHVPPYRVMTSVVRPPCSDHLPRLLRYARPPPPPPPPPPPLPGHVMRLFATSSNTKLPCAGLISSVTSTAGRPMRFPKMGHTSQDGPHKPR